MSREEAEAPGRYYPVGRNRFGLFLIASLVGSVLLIGLSSWLLGASTGHAAVMLVLALVWMAGSVRSILAPERDRDRYVREAGASPSLRRIRIENIVILIASTAFATVWAQALLYPPPPVSDSALQTPYQSVTE